MHTSFQFLGCLILMDRAVLKYAFCTPHSPWYYINTEWLNVYSKMKKKKKKRKWKEEMKKGRDAPV